MTDERAHRVVIVGGGFGGLSAAQTLADTDLQITLVDRRNFHLFQPLLYQVATGGLSPANIAAPLRRILSRHDNVEVVLGEVEGFDLTSRRVRLADRDLDFDTLVVAAGSRHGYFGNDHWEPLAPGLKTIEDATEIRRRLLIAFEAAEVSNDLDQRRAWMTFVVVGAGPTGVELAGALAELARYTLRHEFRHIDPAEANIVLVDAGNRILPSYTEGLSQKALRSLQRFGVEVLTRSPITDIQADLVTVAKSGGDESIPARTVLWAAGVQASPLAQGLARATGAKLDRAGRIEVNPGLTLPGHANIFVIGDMAAVNNADGPLPGVAPVAQQQGRYVAKVLKARQRAEAGSSDSAAPFRYRNRGTMATIGRSAAVAMIGRWRVSGLFAWLMWLFIHLMQLVRFENRGLVAWQWAWNYITWNRSARLITGAKARLRNPAADRVGDSQDPDETAADQSPH